MPKGFNKKAVEAFMLWAGSASGQKEAAKPPNWLFRTRQLLEDGFPNTRIAGREELTQRNIEIGKSYRREALEGMLGFLEQLYVQLRHDVRTGTAPMDAIDGELDEIRMLRKAWLGR
jgi:hypothetical protein